MYLAGSRKRYFIFNFKINSQWVGYAGLDTINANCCLVAYK